MAKKIMRHVRQRKVAYLASLIVAAVGVGFYLSFFVFGQASAVSGVTLTDTDTAGYGLDGRDFSINWTPASTTPSGYQSTYIYVVTSSVAITTGTVDLYNPVMWFYNYSMSSAAPPSFRSTDSQGVAWATSSQYVAWVYVSSTNPTLVSSSPATVTSDAPSDASAPWIEHMSVHTAYASVASRLYAFVNDGQTTLVQFSDPTDGGAEYFKLYYGADVSVASASTTGAAVSGAGELFEFSIPTSSVPAAGESLEYYLVANDRNNNRRYFCASPGATAEADCLNSPFIMRVVSSGSNTLSGKITSGGANLASAKVFLAGVAKAAVTTDASGDYSFSNISNNTSLDVVATKQSYCKVMMPQTVGTSNKTGVNFSLNSGSCGFYEESGSSAGGAPHVVFTGPSDGSQGVNLGERIRVGWDKALDSTTVNDSNAADVGSNVYLTTDDGSTKIAGSAAYCANSSTPGCSSLFSSDTNVILFTPSSSLVTNTFYTLIITNAVKGSNGQAVEGNRPGAGHRVAFSTIGNSFSTAQVTSNFGTSAQYMPPYVRSMTPAPGMSAAPNVNILLEFNEAMDNSTISTSNITLWRNSAQVLSGVTVTLDSNERKYVTVGHSALDSGSYEVRVNGNVKNGSSIPMRQSSETAFNSSFTVSGSSDMTAPTVYPSLSNNSTGVTVNKVFKFGFSEPLNVNTINTNNITVQRGATSISFTTRYQPGANEVEVAPVSVLAPSTVYTITLGTGITDMAGNYLATSTYTYTTGNSDTARPSVKEARCDDYRCSIYFTEAMNHDTQSDSSWASSVINPTNIVIERTSPSSAVISIAGKPITYDAMDYSVRIEGVAGLAAGDTFRVTASSTVADLSSNTINTSTNNNIFTGPVENSASTFGNFSGDAGMFGPPTAGMMGGAGIGGAAFVPQGFGSFTADQFAMGQADMAYPFNPTASMDSNVFQVRFAPTVAVQTGDQVVLTFPDGTSVINAALDTYSPFYSDFNQFAAGIVTGTAVAVDTTSTKVTVTLGVSGTPSANEPLTVDLRKIINPSIPKSPQTGGYTVGIKIVRSGSTLATKTSMPYYIMGGGSNTLTIYVVAGTATSSPTAGANGSVYMHGGGPGGPMDKALTLTNGSISAVDSDTTTSVRYASLPDGCYGLGTDPFVSLGSNDYFGQMSPEPICLNSGETKTKYLLLTSSSGSGSITTTVKLVDGSGNAYNFGGKDIDIFAGGPGRFVVKSLTAVGIAEAAGYNIKLPANGHWFVGVGPAMPKSASGGKPADLGVMPPPPVDLMVSGLGSGSASVSLGMGTVPHGVSFNNDTDTVSFAFAAADKTVSGTVRDGSSNALSNIEVFLHRQGFGAPVFGTTNASGTFSLAVSEYGNYEIGAFKDGMPPSLKQLEVRPDGVDAGTAPDIYYSGKQITSANPLIITIKKAAYTISGKVLDSNNNSLKNVPVFAIDTNGNTVPGMTGNDGSGYTVYVDNGVWTVRAELPPSETSICGTFSIAVTVSSASQANQNISPSVSTCYSVTGTVSVGGGALTNIPLFVEEWDSTNNRPIIGGFKKGASTDSSGQYSVKVPGSATYRVGTLHPDYGELSATKAVATTNTSQNITVSVTSTVTFNFTGGGASMNAFIELKNASDKTKRVTKQQSGLGSSASLMVESGASYSYFVDVFGIGKFTGSVDAGGTVTLNLGLTGGTSYITVTGTAYDNSGNPLSGALVTFTNTSTGVVETALTATTGVYTASIKSGTYSVDTSLANYVAAPAATAAFTTNTSAYDFGGASPDIEAPKFSSYTIEGTVSTSAGAAITDGYVWATNASGSVVTAPIDPDGTYSLGVTTGTWSIKAAGPNHSETTKSGSVTVSGASVTSSNFALAASATNVPTSTTGVMAADAGGSINDTEGTGIKITAGPGVLTTGSDDVTLNLERTYTAPDSATFQSLGNTTFDITAKGDSTVKGLTGNAEIQLDYSDLISQLPSGVSESDLKLMYYSQERDAYVPVEGGFTVDPTNNTITGQVDHLTEFVITYTPPGDSGSNPPSNGTGDTSVPTNLSISINSGATTTQSAAVTLTLSATNATQMLISNSSIFTGATWEIYRTTKSWTLTSGAGTKTVYAKFHGSSGNISSVISDAISLVSATAETTATPSSPAVAAPTASTTITTTTSVTPAPLAAPVVAAPGVSAGTVAPSVTAAPARIFTKNLRLGSVGAEVRKLQERLKAWGYYTYNRITGYFGAITKQALQKFQRAKGLTTTGATNEATVAALNNEIAGRTALQPAPAATAYRFTLYLRAGSKGTEVRKLQEKLKQLGYFTYPSITGYYGAATRDAVSRFQRAQGWNPVGVVGSKTRQALNSL